MANQAQIHGFSIDTAGAVATEHFPIQAILITWTDTTGALDIRDADNGAVVFSVTKSANNTPTDYIALPFAIRPKGLWVETITNCTAFIWKGPLHNTR